MAREEVPITGGKAVILGFLAGSMIAGVFSAYGPVIQFIFLVIGIAVLGDVIFARQLQTYIISLVFSAIIGFIFSIVLYVIGVGMYYFILILIALVLMYGHRYIFDRR